MNAAKRYLLIAGCFALAVTTLAVFTPRVAQAVANAMVTVINTASNPIPTQPVHARQAVYLGCEPTIADGAFGSAQCTLFDNSINDGNRLKLYTVPAGKRLVIDSLSGFAQVPSSQSVTGVISTNVVNNTAANNIWLAYQLVSPNTGVDLHQFAMVTVAYSDPGSQLQFGCGRNSTSGSGVCEIEVFGHLEDIQ